jgi:ubiquinone/menaquinone biosynthesis C-methylase UbiE
MTVKSETGLFPNLLSNRQYSGAISTLLHNWPVFAGALFFAGATLSAAVWLSAPWNWLFGLSGGAALAVSISILVASFIVYDWGARREYDRLAELGQVGEANVVIDVTCGKLRGTRGLLPHHKNGHYFLVDIFDPQKMKDPALRRARQMEPSLLTDRRIYRREAKLNRLPLPHQWADVVYCNFSLHEIESNADRDTLFAEFARILKPGGRLLIAEHSRDLLNLLAFGPGAMSFFSQNIWENHLQKAGLNIEHHEKWRGLVHLWVARRPRK